MQYWKRGDIIWNYCNVLFQGKLSPLTFLAFMAFLATVADCQVKNCYELNIYQYKLNYYLQTITITMKSYNCCHQKASLHHIN